MSAPTDKEPFRFSIDLPVRNEWENIDLIRTSVQNCFNAVFKDVDGCRSLSMVTGELLENAMKYGAWSSEGAAQFFRLRVESEQGKMRVLVENPLAEGDGEALLATLAKIQSYPDAEAAYRARLLEIASSTDDFETSRLGLVRVAYEGGCKLRAQIAGRTLTMIAEMNL
jgi:hypothetical protein